MVRLVLQSRGVFFLFAALSLASQACVEAQLATPIEETPVRNDSERPPDPSTDPNAPRPDMGSSPDMPGEDMDIAQDMPTTPDMGAQDMGPQDMGPQDMGPQDMSSPDMNTQPDMASPCAQPPACTFGAQECVGDRIRTCTRDANMCPTWGTTVACPAGNTCSNNACQPIPPQCVDRDGDGRGTNCAAGPDCDDNDPTRYPGAPELCDNRDNNCNNLVDDGVAGVGASCSVGMGACQVTGSQVCDSQGNLACDATPGSGSPEICDGLDNNCDGQTDEGGVCMGGTGVCANDTYQEPNDTRATAWPLPISAPAFGMTCSADKDFYTLSGLTAGQATRVNLAFDDAVADLDLYLYKDGSSTSLNSSSSSSDHESFSFTPAAGSTYVVEVRPYGTGNNNYYRLVAAPTSSLACSSDDAFAPNYARNQAPYLVRSSTESSSSGLQFDAYHCGTSQDDWYDLGTIAAGKTVWAEIWNPDCVFSCPDFDLELYWYDAATGNVVSKDLSAGDYDDERVSHAVTASDTGRYYIRVKSFGDADNYIVSWNRY